MLRGRELIPLEAKKTAIRQEGLKIAEKNTAVSNIEPPGASEKCPEGKKTLLPSGKPDGSKGNDKFR